MPFNSDEYNRRPYWRKFSERWSTLLSYLSVAFACSLGFWAYGNVNDRADTDQQREIEQNERTIAVLCDEIDSVVGGFRSFVDDIIEPGPNRDVILDRLDARLPEGAVCLPEP